MMQAQDFVLQMQGVVKVLGDSELPSLEQWQAIKDMLGEAMAALVAARVAEMEAEKHRYNWNNPLTGHMYGFTKPSHAHNQAITQVGGSAVGYGYVTTTNTAQTP